MSLRIIFMGTPEFSVPILAALADQGHDIAAVYSQPPRPSGRRGLILTKSPVHKHAEKLGIEVCTPKNLQNKEEQDAFRALNADVAVIVAYGLILPPAILQATRLGCYNGHASLLPRWRGAAPIQRAVMSGDRETGMMIMKMDEGLDTGPIAMVEKVVIESDMTAGDLHDHLSTIGAHLMVQALVALEQGDLILRPQPTEGMTYAVKIHKAETRIDWTKSASHIHNQIRSLSPFPGAWCKMRLGDKEERVKVLKSSLMDICEEKKVSRPKMLREGAVIVPCGDGAVMLLLLQKAGGKLLSAPEFLRGAPVTQIV